MNKKFSTLVAALLASGGLFYAVDAMILPASNGVAKTYVAVTKSAGTEAAGQVVSCDFAIGQGFVSAWTLKKVDEGYYLVVKDAPNWFLCQGAIQEIKVEDGAELTQQVIAVTLGEGNKLISGSESEEVYIDEATGEVSLKETEGAGNAYLFTAEGTVVGDLSAADGVNVALATGVSVPVIGGNIATFAGTTISLGTLGEESSATWVANIAEEVLTITAGGKYFKAPTPAGNASLEESSSDASSITIGEGGVLKSGDLFIAISSGAVKTVSAVGASDKQLYLFDADKALVTSLSDITSGDSYFLAEKGSSLNAEKSVDVRITTADLSEPGASVPGMADANVYVENGKIQLKPGEMATGDIPAPFKIESTDDDLLKSESWILVDGNLKSLRAEKEGNAAMYLGAANVKSTVYGLVEKGAAYPVSFTGNALKINTNTVTTTLKATGESLAVENADASVSSGNIVKIVASDGEVGSQLYKITVKSITDETYAYTLVKCNEHGVATESNETIYMGGKYEASVSLKLNGVWQAYDVDDDLFKDDASQVSIGFKVVDAVADSKPYSVNQLLNDFGSKTSFGVTLKHKYTDKDGKDATKTITTGNVFADADLVPVKYEGGELVELTGDNNSYENAFLLKSGDRYIVLETTEGSEWTSIKDDLKNGGYKFTTVSEKVMLSVLTNSGKFNKESYAPYFQFNYDNVKNEGGKGKAVYSIEVKDYSKASFAPYSLYISSFEVNTGVQKGVYLTVTNIESYWVAAELGLNNLVKAKSDNSPLNYTYVNLQFANHPSVMGRDGKVLNGRVPSADAWNTADKSENLFNKPEGQWIVTVNGDATAKLDKDGVTGQKDATSFTFTNRESSATITVNAMYYLGDNKYAVSYSNGYTYAASPATRDTLIITGVKEDIVAGRLQRDGYADLKASDVQDEQFRLLVASAEEDYYVGENHTAKSHFLGLSHDEEAAVNWRIVPLTGAREYDKDGILKTASDSIYAFRYPQYFKDDKLFSKNDTIAIISYALQNTANGEYLTYENPQTTTTLSMICDPNFKSFTTTKDVSNAYRFVLKEKAEGLYNIIGVTGNAVYDKNGYLTDGTDANPFSLGYSKLYGATTLTKQGAVEVENNKYNKINSNDLFKIQKVGAPEYRLQSMGDTIRIFRQENDYDVMFEKGEFLNIGNKAQLTDMAPALYVDTAYVNRGHNNRYQYLLVVNPKYVPAQPCTVAGHPSIHPDTTYGRFLVNLIDTAYVTNKNGSIHSNKYINLGEAGETYAKLGFVYGFRTGDKLYITDKNYKTSGNASDVIDLGTSDFNVAKFAFRYINPVNHEADGSFKIQTGYYNYNSYIATGKQPNVSNDGYLKNINGVVVVAQGYEAGDKFDLAAEHSNPTANEGINGASTFRVAAIDGAVVIKGAAGKKVVISNLLGQPVASTVITSDEATISVPSGYVTVAVEGEEAAKAIVK